MHVIKLTWAAFLLNGIAYSGPLAYKLDASGDVCRVANLATGAVFDFSPVVSQSLFTTTFASAVLVEDID